MLGLGGILVDALSNHLALTGDSLWQGLIAGGFALGVILLGRTMEVPFWWVLVVAAALPLTALGCPYGWHLVALHDDWYFLLHYTPEMPLNVALIGEQLIVRTFAMSLPAIAYGAWKLSDGGPWSGSSRR